ncbi:MAG TPA: agmatine deiminase family protein [Candidatus Xenobia bacterium]|jgi:agmatine deiminase
MTPAEQGYRMPAEWAPHASTWISWPHEPTTWPGRLPQAEACVARWVRALAGSERVDINVLDAQHQAHVEGVLEEWDIPLAGVAFHPIPTADAWIRDYGPTFVKGSDGVAAVRWQFDAWGGKGVGYYGENEGRDRLVAEKVASAAGVPVFDTGLVLEGGAIDVNGEGVLIATRDCLLSHRGRPEAGALVEGVLHDFLGVERVVWLENAPLPGDDTDGHVDNLARFTGPRTVLLAWVDKSHPLYDVLRRNRVLLERDFEVIPLELPAPVRHRGQSFPASYLNFYIGNRIVLAPIYADRHDVRALETLSRCFPDRGVVPIDCCDYILGQGAIHCSTQQQPA